MNLESATEGASSSSAEGMQEAHSRWLRPMYSTIYNESLMKLDAKRSVP